MAFVRFSRRRFTLVRLSLICFAFLGVLLWLYMKSDTLQNSSENSSQAKFLADRKEFRNNWKFSKLTAPQTLSKSTKRESVFRNPALLHKLRGKLTSSSSPIRESRFLNKNHVAKHYNFTLPQLKVTPGLGEHGIPVILPKQEQKLADQVFNSAAFNVYLSDRISVNRSVPDSRNPKCEYETYDKNLPSASVIIIFTNEIWSTLIRTINSVINRTPVHLLHEIILVDDFSSHDELKYYLKDYIVEKFPSNLVKLIRFKKRQGLIRARLEGAKKATGDVLVFLDSHCEANVQWLEPLVQRIKENRNAVVCPIIDVIDDKTFEYYATNLEYFQVGGFTWNGHFTWIEVSEKEELRRKSEIGPTRSPTMAGGLFAIEREYFWDIGSYDPGMEIWGGENLEMSFRVWMCGGTLEIVPCSHVGHVFRSFHPYKFPNNKDTHGINTVRTVEVWMEDFKKYFYYHRPDLKTIDYGDITDRLELKKQLKCKSFQWFLDEIYPDKFIFDRGVKAHGYLKNPFSHLCLDTLSRDEDKAEPIGLFPCNPTTDIVINQLISLTNDGELRIEENCAEVNDDAILHHELPVIMTKCHGRGDNQKWSHKMGGVVYHEKSGKCLDAGNKKSGDDAVVRDCHGGHFQVWWFQKYDHPDLKIQKF